MGRGTGKGNPWGMSRGGATNVAAVETGGHKSYSSAVAALSAYYPRGSAGHKQLRAYTGTNYENINAALYAPERTRSTLGDAKYEEVLQEAHRLKTSVEKAMSAGHYYRGQVWRRSDMPQEAIDSWLKSGEIRTNSFWSTTVNKQIAQGFAGNTLFAIKGSKGLALKGLSQLPSEEEVLMGPGQRLKIKSHRFENGTHYFELKYTGNGKKKK